MQEVIWRCSMPVKQRGGGLQPHGEIITDYVPFEYTIDGNSYEADLCDQHKQAVRESLALLISASTKMPSRGGQTVRAVLKGKKGTFTTKDVRKWLKDEGMEVSDSGRLPNELIERYRAAHSQ